MLELENKSSGDILESEVQNCVVIMRELGLWDVDKFLLMYEGTFQAIKNQMIQESEKMRKESEGHSSKSSTFGGL